MTLALPSGIEALFVGYLIAMACGYLTLNLLSVSALKQHMDQNRPHDRLTAFDQVAPPVSILVPAYNEAAGIATSIRSLLQLTYPQFEIVIVNDGSTDETLDQLINAFDLVPVEPALRSSLRSQPIKQAYRSTSFPNITVLDKHNGGKADALNAAANAAQYPYVCSVDADSILQRDSMKRVMRAFLGDHRTIAAGGTIRIANGCKISGGFLESIGLPRSPLALFQIVEYFRAFLFGRMGWHPLNGLLIISGAFGVFKREALERIGGYRADTVGEDMDLVMRLHVEYKRLRVPYRIAFVPDPICWTEAPEDLRTLSNQRSRWQRGLGESLIRNSRLPLSSNGGAAGWLAYPFMLIFELLSPLVELVGYVSLILAWVGGWIDPDTAVAYLAMAIGLGVMLSVSALLLEESSFHLYPKFRHLGVLILFAVLENFGYRQLVAAMRLRGFFQWLTGRKIGWGKMRRLGASQATPDESRNGPSARWQARRMLSALSVCGGIALALTVVWTATQLYQTPSFPSSPPVLTATDSDVSLISNGQTDTAVAGSLLLPGDHLIAAPTGNASLKLDADTKVHLLPDSGLRLDDFGASSTADNSPHRLTLLEGGVQVVASRSTGTTIIHLNNGSLELESAVVLVLTDDSDQWISVEAGRARVSDGSGRQLTLHHGHGLRIDARGLGPATRLESPGPTQVSGPQQLRQLAAFAAALAPDTLIELTPTDASASPRWMVAGSGFDDGWNNRLPDGQFRIRLRTRDAQGLTQLPTTLTQRVTHHHHRERLHDAVQQRDYRAATQHIDAALDGAPMDTQLRVAAANAQLGVGNAAEALRVLRPALQLSPGSSDVQLALGNINLRTGNWPEAELAFSNVLKGIPDTSEALTGLAEVHLATGRVNSAHELALRAWAQNGRLATYGLLAARAALSLRANELALLYLNQSEARDTEQRGMLLRMSREIQALR